MRIKYWPEELREHLRKTYKYNGETGELTRVVMPTRGRQAASGSTNSNGKRTLSVFVMGRQWLLEQGRIALFLLTGKQHTGIVYLDGDFSNLAEDNLVWQGAEITPDYDTVESREELIARSRHANEALRANRKEDKKAQEYAPALTEREREYLRDQKTDPSVYALTPERIAAMSAKQDAEDASMEERLARGGWVDTLVAREDVYVEVEDWLRASHLAGVSRKVLYEPAYLDAFLLRLRLYTKNNVPTWSVWDTLLCSQVSKIEPDNFGSKWEWDAAQIAVRQRWEAQGHTKIAYWMNMYDYRGEVNMDDFETVPATLLRSVETKLRLLVDGDNAWEALYKEYPRLPAIPTLTAQAIARVKMEILARAVATLRERPLSTALVLDYSPEGAFEG